MGVGLALAAACCYGVTHFLAGLLARVGNGITVSVYAQLGGTAASVPLALLLPAGRPDPAAWGWALLGGAGAGLGVAFLYRGLARGQMSVVAPLSEVCAAALPVLVGVVLLAERLGPAAATGVLAALPAIALLTRGRGGSGPGRTAGVSDGLLGGTGIAVNYIGLAEISATAGLWPFVLTRAVSVLAIVPLAVRAGATLRPSGGPAARAMAVGVVGTVAALLFLLSTRIGQVSVNAVLASLYPVVTVLLGVLVLRERLTRGQVAGLLFAGVAFALCALG